ncbi:GGDEF domain-containing protein [Shewanella aestuarii]|uniref:diguanylate cyclase n=1 Tax=Shewanella aestuarii TaxID=1028752 RepID=A0A6G9QHD8_9GAMM|nr:GGDEF domain-containing protein [Shewanella aestuarii]QIR13882.1 GGDEF domain-containing protein [Shewanella aestuarii]
MLKSILLGWFFSALLVMTCGVVASEQYSNQLVEVDQLIGSDFQLAKQKLLALDDKLEQFTEQEKAHYYMLMSLLHIYLSEYQQAKIALDNALKASPSEELLTRIYLYKVTVSNGLKDYESAFLELATNLSRIDTYQDTKIKIASYIRLLNVLMDLYAYEEMLKTAKLVLNLNQGQDVKSECYAMLYYAVAMLKLENPQESISLFDETGSYCAANGLPLIDIMSQKGKAIAYFELSDFNTASRLFEQAYKRYLPFEFQVELNDIKSYLANIYFNQQEYEKSYSYASELANLNEDKVNNEVKTRAHEVLAMLASHQGDFAKAYQHQVIAHALSLQELNEKKLKQNAYQMARFDSAEKSRENNNLIQEHELMMKQKDLFLKEKSSSIMFSTLLFGVCIGLGLLLITAWMQRNQYMRQAQRDGLTGIYNRQTGQDLAENELVQVLANNGHYSIMILDLDFFKTINDRFGHATGDWALKKITHVVEDIIRPSDIFCRLGGEEFVIYMPYTDELTAFNLAETVRQEVERINTKYSGHDFSITVSIGVSALNKEDLSLDPLLNKADIALYECKSQGRNKVLVYKPSFDA